MPKIKKRITKIKKPEQALSGWEYKVPCPRCNKIMLCQREEKRDADNRIYSGKIFLCRDCELRFDEANIWAEHSNYSREMRKTYKHKHPKPKQPLEEGSNMAEKKELKKLVKPTGKTAKPAAAKPAVKPATKPTPAPKKAKVSKRDIIAELILNTPKSGRTAEEVNTIIANKSGTPTAISNTTDYLGLAVRLKLLTEKSGRYYKA